MRIIFIDDIEWDYTVDTAYRRPLGGSQSALCYLAEELARRGHDVALVNNTTEPGVSRGVSVFGLSNGFASAFEPAPDVVIVLNQPGWGDRLRSLVGPSTKTVLWLSLAHDQEMLFGLAGRPAFDAYAFLSDWQRRAFERAFGMDPRRSVVLRYGIGPRFAGLFEPGESLSAAKSEPPVMAYCSAPFRGLHVLVYYAFERIRAFVPAVRLKVFSSMKMYPYLDGDGDEQFADMYRRCRETEGIDYVGSLPQPELARELRAATMLAYPCVWPETACLAVMESMAAGCSIVTSDFAVLPETTNGHAQLIPYREGGDVRAFGNAFVDAAVAVLEDRGSAGSEARLRSQVDEMNTTATWSARAREWEAWLSGSHA